MAHVSRRHIKALMHQLFEKAMLWELIPVGRNPMELVHVKGIGKRAKRPVILGEDECLAPIESLPDPYRTMVLVAICTGLRISEIRAALEPDRLQAPHHDGQGEGRERADWQGEDRVRG